MRCNQLFVGFFDEQAARTRRGMRGKNKYTPRVHLFVVPPRQKAGAMTFAALMHMCFPPFAL